MFTMSFLWFCTLIHCPDPKFALSPMIIELLILWYPSNIFLSKAMLAPPSASLKFVISAVVERVFALYFRFLYPIWKLRIRVGVKRCLIINFPIYVVLSLVFCSSITCESRQADGCPIRSFIFGVDSWVIRRAPDDFMCCVKSFIEP